MPVIRHYSCVQSSDDERETSSFRWHRSLLASTGIGFAVAALGFGRAVTVENETTAVAMSYVPYIVAFTTVMAFVLSWFLWDYERQRPPSKDEEDREREQRHGWRSS